MGNLSPGEIVVFLIGGILALAGAIVTIGNAIEKIVKVFRAAKAPNAEQDRRIKALEDWREDVDRKFGEVDRKFSNDDEAISGIREENHAVLQALLALLDHGIDGNNIDQMQAAKKGLQTHLINK